MADIIYSLDQGHFLCKEFRTERGNSPLWEILSGSYNNTGLQLAANTFCTTVFLFSFVSDHVCCLNKMADTTEVDFNVSDASVVDDAFILILVSTFSLLGIIYSHKRKVGIYFVLHFRTVPV